VVIAPERRLGHEQHHHGQQGPSEDGDHVEGPLPADRVCDLAHQHRREERATEKGKVAQRHPLAALVDEIQISNAGIDQCFKGCQGDALEDARPQQTGVVATAGAAPRAADDQHDGAEEIQMALAPDAGGRHEDEAGDADAEEV
ncbi:hypothetical protein LTR16_012306, partial [Cryomyces antarcticus]